MKVSHRWRSKRSNRRRTQLESILHGCARVEVVAIEPSKLQRSVSCKPATAKMSSWSALPKNGSQCVAVGLGDQGPYDLAEEVRASLKSSRRSEFGRWSKHGRGEISGERNQTDRSRPLKAVDRYLSGPPPLYRARNPDRGDVVTGEMIALPGEHSGKPAVVCLIGIPGQRLLASQSQRGRTQPSCSTRRGSCHRRRCCAILVGQMTLEPLLLRDDLSEADHMCPVANANERIGAEDTGGGYASCFDLVVDRIESYRVEHVVQ